MQEIIRSVEARPGDEAIVTELDLRLDEWASAELKSVAADFYHALILFCRGRALKIVLTNKEGEGFEAWRALVNKYEPTSKASWQRFCARRLMVTDHDLRSAEP